MENKTPKLNRISLFFAIVIIMKLMSSCSDSTSNQPANAEGFAAIETELKDKFGTDAFYTDLTIAQNTSVGNIIGVTVTEDPESLKMGQWNLMQDAWKQNSDITLEVPEGTKAADYMFQLTDKINLSKLGELAEKSSTQLTAEKNIDNPALKMAFVKFPNNGDMQKAEYNVMLEPENGGTTFTFRYRLNGDLIDMDY